jgi:hypothetical protein
MNMPYIQNNNLKTNLGGRYNPVNHGGISEDSQVVSTKDKNLGAALNEDFSIKIKSDEKISNNVLKSDDKIFNNILPNTGVKQIVPDTYWFRTEVNNSSATQKNWANENLNTFVTCVLMLLVFLLFIKLKTFIVLKPSFLFISLIILLLLFIYIMFLLFTNGISVLIIICILLLLIMLSYMCFRVIQNRKKRSDVG